MNVYDDLGARAGDGAAALLVLLDEALGRCGEGQRGELRALREGLVADPELRLVWLLRSRSLGVVHPVDAALARLEAVDGGLPTGVEAEVVAADLRESLLAPRQREAALRALIELPEVDPGPVYEVGLFFSEEE